MSNETLEQRIARKKKELADKKAGSAGAAAPAAHGSTASAPVANKSSDSSLAQAASQFADVVPEVEDTEGAASDGLDQQLDAIIERIGIVDAYNRWIGKKPAPVVLAGQKDNIMIRCPWPGHEDKKPSAAINNVVGNGGVFMCYRCARGGDKLDLAAIHYGMENEYKNGNSGKAFHDLRRHIGREYGWDFLKKPDGSYQAFPPEGQVNKKAGRFSKHIEKASGSPAGGAPADSTDATPAPVFEPESESGQNDPEPVSNVTSIRRAPDPSKAADDVPNMDWRTIFRKPGFIRTYMEATSIDDSPEMYHLAHALLGLGFAVGRNAELKEEEVYGNLLVCLVGRTSEGKTRARRHLMKVLSAQPFQFDETNPTGSDGVRVVPSPSTGEGMFAGFENMQPDIANPKFSRDVGNVRGLVTYGELTELTGRASRNGNILKPVLMGFYDNDNAMGNTTSGGGIRRVKEPFCSVWSTVQPGRVGDLLDKSDDASGFLNRWSFIIGKSKRKFARIPKAPDMTAATAELIEIHDWAANKRDIDFDDAGGARFDEFFYSRIHDLIETGPEMVQRAGVFLKKLCLLMAINFMQEEIDESIVALVEDMWPYFLDCYRYIDSRVGQEPMTELEERVLAYIKRVTAAKKIPPPIGDLNKAMKQECKATREEVQRAVNTLEKAGEIKTYDKPQLGPGRKTIRYEAVNQ